MSTETRSQASLPQLVCLSKTFMDFSLAAVMSMVIIGWLCLNIKGLLVRFWQTCIFLEGTGRLL